MKPKKWQPETTHGNYGKRRKWQRNLDLTIAALDGATIRSLADKYSITPCMVSTVFQRSIRELECHHGWQIKGLPKDKYFPWTLRSLRPYKEILIPLLYEHDHRRIMTRQEKRTRMAINELIKICDDGYATGTLLHCLDSLRSLGTFYASITAKEIKGRCQ